MSRISVTMAMESLKDQVRATQEAKEEYARAIAIRDDLIRDCRAAKIPERTLVGITGLSRDSIHRIANSPSKHV